MYFIGFGLLSARCVITSKKDENEIKSNIYQLQMNCLSSKHSGSPEMHERHPFYVTESLKLE